ncbi:hypothetical protein THIARS_90117 [Thiomonas delicata]|uniref:Uncharacterized protein n=1 Tax=Thiomonas delicata TaxID=364030 RepID=A0A238D9I2_THIDL|nr:hypothetical protein THIARS_90117 [Thiomonas delicata]
MATRALELVAHQILGQRLGVGMHDDVLAELDHAPKLPLRVLRRGVRNLCHSRRQSLARHRQREHRDPLCFHFISPWLFPQMSPPQDLKFFVWNGKNPTTHACFAAHLGPRHPAQRAELSLGTRNMFLFASRQPFAVLCPWGHKHAPRLGPGTVAAFCGKVQPWRWR